jgi:hypothetical protein
MTRTTIGGLAAGTFVVGLLVGLVVPGAVARADDDRLMPDHLAAMGSMNGSMMGGSMDQMMGGSMDQMMGGGAVPMMPGGTAAPAGHEWHHASPGASR